MPWRFSLAVQRLVLPALYRHGVAPLYCVRSSGWTSWKHGDRAVAVRERAVRLPLCFEP